MDDVYFSSGQAARELGVTQAKVRALCESEAIDSIRTTGRQFRIPQNVVERLKRDGLPAVPRPLPEPDRTRTGSRARSNRGEVALLAPPSEAVIDSAERVARLEDDVKCIHLEKELEEGRDFFREREEREAQRQAEREEAEWQRESQAAAERQRQNWQAKWIEFALKAVAYDVPEPFRLDVHRAVVETLHSLNPLDPETNTRALVSAAVARALVLWHNQKRVADAIEAACDGYSLPWELRFDSKWKARTHTAAANAIARLRNGASASEMKAAAEGALQPLVSECESTRVRSEIIASVWAELSGGTREEWEEGKESVQEALSDLPEGASRRELERARAAALAPFRAAIAVRQDKQARAGLFDYLGLRLAGWPERLQRQTEEAIREAVNRLPAGTPVAQLEVAKEQVIDRFRAVCQRHERKSRLVDWGLRQIQANLGKLKVDWEIDETARELEEPIRAVLKDELRGDETEEQVAVLVRRSLKDELDIR